MSGTSLDGIDAVLVDLNSSIPKVITTCYQPYDEQLRSSLLALHQPNPDELHQSQIIGNQLAHLYAKQVWKLLSNSGIKASQISAVGSHGQTIRHCPEQGYSLQIGNSALLTELTGITVASDFRSRDIAAGGQGAPLIPAFHNIILRHPSIHRVIVNIGGISNITNLAPDVPTSGFDCGPGNMLMDAWCNLHTGKEYDDKGSWGATGNVLPDILNRLLKEPFFQLPPPKSCGRELFNIRWLESNLSGSEIAEDVQATLLELTCLSISRAILQYYESAQEIYLCGGGAHNLALFNRLDSLLPNCIVQTTDALGISGDYLEALAFAWLAQQTLLGKPANLPLVTGAKHSCILGTIYPNSNLSPAT